MSDPTTPPAYVASGTAQGRWVLVAAVLGSGMALLDGTVVNIALRTVGADLDASIAQLQWVLNAYLLALASLILVGGSLGDHLGRRRVFLIGVAWFAVASAVCGLAQTPGQLIVARLLQGIGAALLTPGSLAMISGSFRPADRGRVIGQWAGLGGIAAALGPFLGGVIVAHLSWRWIFLINVPVAVFVVLVAARHVPESRDPEAGRRFDVLGASLGALGLGGVSYALIESSTAPRSWVVTAAAVGGLAMGVFVLLERRLREPLVPMRLFASRTFSVANLLTLLVYGALGAMLFFLVLQLQIVTGWSPLAAGLATLPLTLVMLALSSRAGALAARIGPRVPLTVGPLLCGAGTLLLREVDAATGYWTGVLPGMLVFSVRAGAAGRAPDLDRARGGAGPLRRHRERHQQRRGPDGLAALGVRPAGPGRDRGCGLPGPGGVRRGLRAGAARLRRAAVRRRPGRRGRAARRPPDGRLRGSPHHTDLTDTEPARTVAV